jgi:two-component system KDP operon response regulator KdpE
MKGATVLIVEDEPQIRRFVRTALEAEGYQVHEAENAGRGLIEAGTRAWTQLPIIVLSARTQEEGKINALDSGADDYLTKPFSVEELKARIRVVLRRGIAGNADEASEFSFGDVRVDFVKRRVLRNEQEVHLTTIEYRLLTVLIQNAGKVLTHRQLLKEVWGPAYVENSHYLRTYMGHLRQKLEADPAQPEHLLTETGVGYRLVE